jgi:hypothetical protein
VEVAVLQPGETLNFEFLFQGSLSYGEAKFAGPGSGQCGRLLVAELASLISFITTRIVGTPIAQSV